MKLFRTIDSCIRECARAKKKSVINKSPSISHLARLTEAMTRNAEQKEKSIECLWCAGSVEQPVALNIELKGSGDLQPFRSVRILSTGQVIIIIGHTACHFTVHREEQIEHRNGDISWKQTGGIIEIQAFRDDTIESITLPGTVQIGIGTERSAGGEQIPIGQRIDRVESVVRSKRCYLIVREVRRQSDHKVIDTEMILTQCLRCCSAVQRNQQKKETQRLHFQLDVPEENANAVLYQLSYSVGRERADVDHLILDRHDICTWKSTDWQRKDRGRTLYTTRYPHVAHLDLLTQTLWSAASKQIEKKQLIQSRQIVKND